MKQTLYILEPSAHFLFEIQALQYVPDRPSSNGYTLVFLHSLNTHKETFEPMIYHLLRETPLGLRIRDVWSIENPNQGASALKNRRFLDTPGYREKWTAMEYCRAVHAFLTSTSHGIDFRSRSLVGLAHSAASAPLLLLQHVRPAVTFQGLIFMDAAILPVGSRATKVLCNLFGKWAQSKPNTWPSREAAAKQLAATAFKRWDPNVLRLFVEHAIRPVEGSTDVTLNCSPLQEAAYYLSPDADLVDVPTEIFLQLIKDDHLPIHTIICLNDEYKGMDSEMKHFQIDNVKKMITGSVQIVEGGHMFPQTEPAICARAIGTALENLQSQGRAEARL